MLATVSRASLLILSLVASCGGVPSPSPSAGSPARVDTAAERLWFPTREMRALRADGWGRGHIALAADGRIYASTGEDLPTMVAGGLLAALAAPTSAEPLRCAVIGLGSAVEASALAGLGCARVDVFERDADLFDNARALGTWVDPRLRIEGSTGPFRVRAEPPGEAERYHVIVQSIAATLLARQRRLFSLERFRGAAARLAPGGVFVQHVQLYEIHAATHRRMLATLAGAFEHVVGFAPAPRSSDTLMLASNAPIRLSLARLGAWSARPGTRRWVDAMAPYSAYDFVARGLYASRGEVVAWTQGAAPYSAADPMPRDALPLRPPVPTPAAWGDEGDAWEARLEEFSSQFDEAFVSSFYEPGWTSGRLCPAGPAGCAALASTPVDADFEDFALSLVAHGRYAWATDAVEAHIDAGGREAGIAVEVLSGLLTTDDAPAFDPLDPLPPEIGEPNRSSIAAAWARRHEDAGGVIGTVNGAMSLVEAPDSRAAVLLAMTMVALDAGPPERAHRSALGLADEYEAWCDAHPAAWYWIARAHDGWGDGVAAVRAMARYQRLVR